MGKLEFYVSGKMFIMHLYVVHESWELVFKTNIIGKVHISKTHSFMERSTVISLQHLSCHIKKTFVHHKKHA